MAQAGQRPRHHRQSSRLLRLASPNGHQQHGQHDFGQERGTDAETLQFIKKTLTGLPSSTGGTEERNPELDSTPGDEFLPPLTSSDEVDIQLYAIIAAVLSQFVQSWYNRFTSDDQFAEDMLHIIAHCTRGLESRLRRIDLEGLLLGELPGVMITHINGTHLIPEQYNAATDFEQLLELHRMRAREKDHQRTSEGSTITFVPIKL